MLKNRQIRVTGIILSVLILGAIVIPYFHPFFDPLKMNYGNFLSPPSFRFPFGTDSFGRDLFSRVILGIRTSSLVGVSVMAITTVLGSLIGVLAGWSDRADTILMTVMDAMMSFPSLLLALGIMAALGSRAINVVIALSIVYTPRTARIIRGATISIREEDYIEAAQSYGASVRRILSIHVLPNCFASLMVQSTFIFAYAILAEAGLGFVGVGIQPPAPSLGNILGEARNHLRAAPWVTFFPGIAIFSLVLNLNLLGDGLRSALDPRTTSTQQGGER